MLELRDPAVSVMNYGQSYYFSSQELVAFITLLKSGQVPKIAVFIDGLNDVIQGEADQPMFTSSVRALWDARRAGRKPILQSDLVGADSDAWAWIPMVRLARKNAWRFGVGRRPNAAQGKAELAKGDPGWVMSRYMNNLRILRSVCREYDTQCLFVWQPVPFYKYDPAWHPKSPYAEDAIPSLWAETYARLEAYAAPDFLYLGDMLEGVAEKVFVDDTHYNEVWNERIAQRIADQLMQHSQSSGGVSSHGGEYLWTGCARIGQQSRGRRGLYAIRKDAQDVQGLHV
jgi:hypothetical protein